MHAGRICGRIYVQARWHECGVVLKNLLQWGFHKHIITRPGDSQSGFTGVLLTEAGQSQWFQLNAADPSFVLLRGCLLLQVKRHDSESEKKLLETPDLNKYVFCQVLADCGQVRRDCVCHIGRVSRTGN
jgi:hypothetical protein